MKRPIYVLDLYCGAGGVTRGIADAAVKLGLPIHITGVDIQAIADRWYAAIAGRCQGEFVLGDAISYLDQALCENRFDYIHASPPCKAFTSLRGFSSKANQQDWQLIEVQRMLRASTVPYDLENVPGAPIRRDVVLRGYQFGLPTIRKRIFEIGNWWFMPHLPTTKIGTQRGGDFLSVAGKGGYNRINPNSAFQGFNGAPTWTTGSVKRDRQIAMGIDWMTTEQMAQAIPPAFAEYIFTHFLRQQL